METLKVYEQKTSSFRKPSSTSESNQLLRSLIGKHGPVSSSTIARWLKAGLQSAGVDVTRFQAHSVRAATTSKAFLSGLTMEDTESS